jgi:hypothetical protein
MSQGKLTEGWDFGRTFDVGVKNTATFWRPSLRNFTVDERLLSTPSK